MSPILGGCTQFRMGSNVRLNAQKKRKMMGLIRNCVKRPSMSDIQGASMIQGLKRGIRDLGGPHKGGRTKLKYTSDVLST